MYEFRPDAVVPRHRHPQEQITLIQAGEVRLTVGHVDHRLLEGSWSVLPPDVEYALTAGGEGAEVLAIEVPQPQPGDVYTLIRAVGEDWAHPDSEDRPKWTRNVDRTGEG